MTNLFEKISLGLGALKSVLLATFSEESNRGENKNLSKLSTPKLQNSNRSFCRQANKIFFVRNTIEEGKNSFPQDSVLQNPKDF